jgi:hypothetical protein
MEMQVFFIFSIFLFVCFVFNSDLNAPLLLDHVLNFFSHIDLLGDLKF